MSILQALAEAAQDEVAAGGFVWRIRKVGNAEVAELQGGALALLPVDLKRAAAEYAAKKAGRPEGEDEGPDIGKQLEELVTSSPLNMRKMAEHQAVIVCAGTTAVRSPTSEWEPVKLVLGDKAEASKGQLRVADLPAGVEPALFAAIMRLSTDGGRAIERLQRFRGEPGDADAVGPVGS